MKKLLISTSATLLMVGSIFAQSGQSSISAPRVRRETLPATNPAAQSEGSLQRSARVGSPLQLLNPFAPADYGSGTDFVADRDQPADLHPRDRSRTVPIAIRLFSIAF